MARRQRVLLLVHPFFRPDIKVVRSRTERDVWVSLKRAGFDCRIAAVQASLTELERELSGFRPHVVFNLLEEFRDEGIFDFHAVSFLEACGVPFTGCNPRGLIISRHKLWVSQLALGCGVPAPATWLVKGGHPPAPGNYPLILKLNTEHASLGLTTRNVVKNPREYRAEVKRMHGRFGSDLIAQTFVPGRELSVALLGNQKPRPFAPRELRLREASSIVTERIKFSAKTRRRHKVRAVPFAGDPDLSRDLQRSAVQIFRHLGLSGYARCDFRLADDGSFHLIDVNANPNLERTEDFAVSARHAGVSYESLLKEIIALALR